MSVEKLVARRSPLRDIEEGEEITLDYIPS